MESREIESLSVVVLIDEIHILLYPYYIVIISNKKRPAPLILSIWIFIKKFVSQKW